MKDEFIWFGWSTCTTIEIKNTKRQYNTKQHDDNKLCWSDERDDGVILRFWKYISWLFSSVINAILE